MCVTIINGYSLSQVSLKSHYIHGFIEIYSEFCTGLAEISYKVGKNGHFTQVLLCNPQLPISAALPKENTWKE